MTHDRGISIRPAPGKCCPEKNVVGGVCTECGHKHGDE